VWLTRPLDYFANSVQYPLATSSRRNLPNFNIRFAFGIRNPTKVAAPKDEPGRVDRPNSARKSKSPASQTGLGKLPVGTLPIKRPNCSA